MAITELTAHSVSEYVEIDQSMSLKHTDCPGHCERSDSVVVPAPDK